MSTTDTETSPAISPDVRLFVARVRTELADLDPDEVLEITDGLEADLAELVAERGPGALGDPVEYAGELRAAAGLSSAGPARMRRGVRAGLTELLDNAHARWDALVDHSPGDVRPVLDWLRPLWWIVRGWVAVQVAYLVLAGGSYPGGLDLVPHLGGFGWIPLAVAVAGSVALGLGRFWPGGSRGLVARVVLLGLNLFAVLMLPPVLGWAAGPDQDAYSLGFADGQASAYPAWDASYGIDEQAGVYSNGRWVTNVYPYDAEGRPLVGVQLFDQLGEPINVVAAPECPDEMDGWTVQPLDLGPECYDPMTGEPVQGRVPYLWTNGAAQLANVFPLPTRMQDDLERSATAFAEAVPPAIGGFPLAAVPPASLPGITTGVVGEQSAAEPPAAEPSAGQLAPDRGGR